MKRAGAAFVGLQTPTDCEGLFRMKAPIYLLAAIMLLAASCGDSKDDTNEPDRFYAHSIAGLTLNDSKLTLTGVDPVTLSTSGPYPATRPISTEEFVTLWEEGENSFADDPPKADIACTVDGEVLNYVVELRMPELSGDQLTYAVQAVGDSNLPVSGTTCTGVVASNTTSQRKDVQQQPKMNAITSTPENVNLDNWVDCLVGNPVCQWKVEERFMDTCMNKYGRTEIECLVVIAVVYPAIEYLIMVKD